MHSSVVVIASLTALAGCGEKKEGENSGTKAVPAAQAPAAKPAEPATPPGPPGPKVIMPGDVSAEQRLSIADLDAILDQWPAGKEVTVAGYATFFSRDEGNLGPSVELTGQPGKHGQLTDIGVKCHLATDSAEKVSNEVPLVLKGKLLGFHVVQAHVVTLDECSLVSKGKSFDPAARAVPGSPAPIPADKLRDAVIGWYGKELSVTGAFAGVTKWEPDGKHVNLVAAPGDSKIKVLCLLPVEWDRVDTATMNQQRNALTVRGRFKKLLDGALQLVPCTVVSK